MAESGKFPSKSLEIWLKYLLNAPAMHGLFTRFLPSKIMSEIPLDFLLIETIDLMVFHVFEISFLY